MKAPLLRFERGQPFKPWSLVAEAAKSTPATSSLNGEFLKLVIEFGDAFLQGLDVPDKSSSFSS